MDLNFLKLGGMRKMGEDITASQALIDPALSVAGITTIKVDGKDMPASEAPLASKIAALLAVNPPNANAQQIADVLVSNDVLTKQLMETGEKLKVAEGAVSKLTMDNSNITRDLATATESVNKLTASNAELGLQLKAATNQFSEKQREVNTLNREVSKMAIAFACVELKGEDSKALSPNASAEAKENAADKIPVAEKLTAISGALNAAAARVGIDFNTVPNGGPAAGAKSPVSVVDQYNAIQHPQERQAFYRKNKEAIDASFRQ